MPQAKPITGEALFGCKDRFSAYTSIAGKDECWEWSSTKNKKGYGIIRHRKEGFLAHRLALAYDGRIPSVDDVACHTCDNPGCVNPRHLYLGTYADNSRDQVLRGRLPDRRGSGNGRATLTASRVIKIRRSDKTNAALAEEYGVAESTISMARSGATWSHL